jgi:hypothetical protein
VVGGGGRGSKLDEVGLVFLVARGDESVDLGGVLVNERCWDTGRQTHLAF